jgi:hypothetical protein
MTTENISVLIQQQKNVVLSECMQYISVNSLSSGLTKQEWSAAVDSIDEWVANNLLQAIDSALSENIQQKLSTRQKLKISLEIIKAQIGNF